MIVVSCPQRAEESLLAGAMRCPGCAGTLRPHGHARTRTVRGLGAATLTVTPRRARCAECGATQILLPGALSARRADASEVIGHALAAKAAGSGFRAIAATLDRSASTVRRWLRRAPEHHARWLYERAVAHCTRIDRQLLIRSAAQPPTNPAAGHPPTRHGSTGRPPHFSPGAAPTGKGRRPNGSYFDPAGIHIE